mmetsp:Transcript_73555/g.208388  ORF Transcript_73555/g.208388 Transcript_73555/m.208388 type:complete len:125 (+) Transcript_73555:57-431(+)
MSKSGVLKMWNDEKGFGFIKPEDGGEDVFMHRSALPQGDEVSEGDSLRFDVVYDDRKGKTRADNVKIVGGGSGGGGGGKGKGKSKGGYGDYGRDSYGGGGYRGRDDGGDKYRERSPRREQRGDW